jgi:hypothetical protein
VSAERRDGWVTRRGALIAAGITAAAALGPRWTVGAAWGAPVLHPRRAVRYRRLVAALGHAPDGRFRGCRAGRATRDFARWYARQDATVRAHADAVLDALAPAMTAGYARLAHAPSAGPRASAVVAAALDLAAITCEPPLTEDERPVTPALWAQT